MALTNKLTAIADAIRAKTGGQSLLSLTQMVTEIGTLSKPTGSLSITQNDTYDVTGYEEAVVNVQGGITPTGSLSITQNDTYDVTQYAQAVVNVPSSGGVIDPLIDKSISGTVNSSVTTIGNYAFFQCTSITDAVFPNATSAGNSVFNGCTGLSSVYLPNVTTLGSSAFSGCTGLESVVLNKATDLSAYYNYFNNCSSLKEVILPSAININSSIFVPTTSSGSVAENIELILLKGNAANAIPNMNCQSTASKSLTKLETLILTNESAVVKLAAQQHLYNTPIANGTGYIYVPYTKLSSYETATNWSVYASQLRTHDDLPNELKTRFAEYLTLENA